MPTLMPMPQTRLAEGLDGVVGEDGVEDEEEPEEVAVHVLEDQRDPALAAVAAVGVGHGAGRRRPPEGAVVGLAVVVAGEAESEGEDQDQQGRRDVPGVDPHAERVAPGDAAAGQAGRVEGRDQVAVQRRAGVVVLADEGGPGGVDDERGEDGDGDDRLDPPPVAAQGRLVGPAPGSSDGNRRPGCVLHRRRHVRPPHCPPGGSWRANHSITHGMVAQSSAARARGDRAHVNLRNAGKDVKDINRME